MTSVEAPTCGKFAIFPLWHTGSKNLKTNEKTQNLRTKTKLTASSFTVNVAI